MKPDLDFQTIGNLGKMSTYFAQEIRKMTPALQDQWDTYNLVCKTTSSFNNKNYIANLLNELRFFGACCLVIASGKPQYFLYLKCAGIHSSDSHIRSERAVNSIRFDDGLVFFIKKKSKEVFRMKGLKGATLSFNDNFSLDETELRRLLRKRVVRVGIFEFEYVSDYTVKVEACVKAYKAVIEKFERIFWSISET